MPTLWNEVGGAVRGTVGGTVGGAVGDAGGVAVGVAVGVTVGGAVGGAAAPEKSDRMASHQPHSLLPMLSNLLPTYSSHSSKRASCATTF